MKIRFTLLFIFVATLANAQFDYYFEDDPAFGLGVGYNFISIVDDDVRPVEVSFRYRINRDHMLQLFVPFMTYNDEYKSQNHPEMNMIGSSLDSKKRLYGVGLDYDYALQSFSSLDFVLGLRAEYQYYKYNSDLTNTSSTGGSSNSISTTEVTSRDKKTNNFILSPNAGLRLRLNRFAIDAKFLLSMLSTRGDVEHRVEERKHQGGNVVSSSEEWSTELSNKFKLKPAVVMSMSFFF